MISWLEKNYKLSLIITLLIGIAIFYISSLTFSSGVGGPPNINAILYHIIAFFLFSFFLSISIVRGKNKKFILLALVASIVYGLFDELHQFFVPGRTTSLSDAFLNFIGISFAYLLYTISIIYRQNKSSI